MGATFGRVKTWVSTEDLEYDDLNAEFDNLLTNLTASGVDDFSANVSQMQTVADPGEVGTESLATSVAGEISRLRLLIKEITGEDYWYETPVTSLSGLSSALGSTSLNNRLTSGRKRSDISASLSAQPVFLVPNGAARTVKLDGTPINFNYYVNGTQYSIITDTTLTNLTAAPSTNNTCLINDAVAADQYWTQFTGEDGSEIPVDNMGTEISSLVGKFAAFKLGGTTDEYFIAHVTSTTSLTKARRGYFFDSTDTPIPRAGYTNNDTITLMKLSWIFAKTDLTLDVCYTNPSWGKDEPGSPAVGDFWFDTDNQTWKKYSGTSFAASNSTLVGICIQDTTNTVGARSFEFFLAYDEYNSYELIAVSNTQVSTRFPGLANVWGSTIKNEHGLYTWDMTADLDSGVAEGASTYYYFYLTEDGDKVISDIRPYDRTNDLRGHYHPHNSWRCIGRAYNDGSSNLSQVESYYYANNGTNLRSIALAETIAPSERKLILNGTSSSYGLPPASLWRGQSIKIIHGGTSITNAYTIDGFGSETIGGAATYILRIAGQSVTLISDGTNILVEDERAPFIDSEIYVDTGNGYGATNTKIRRFTNTRRDTTGVYMTYADSSTLGGSVTVNITGLYNITVCDATAAADSAIGITINGAALTTNIQSVTYANGLRAFDGYETGTGIGMSTTLRLASGDVIRHQSNGNFTGSDSNNILNVVLVKPTLGV